MIKAIALWFPARERALATSLFNSGANVGAVLAPAAVPFVALHFGWDGTFVLAGLAGLAGLGLWLPLFDLPERSRRLSPNELLYIAYDGAVAPAVATVSWCTLLRRRRAWSFVVAKFMTDPVWWFFLI